MVSTHHKRGLSRLATSHKLSLTEAEESWSGYKFFERSLDDGQALRNVFWGFCQESRALYAGLNKLLLLFPLPWLFLKIFPFKRSSSHIWKRKCSFPRKTLPPIPIATLFLCEFLYELASLSTFPEFPLHSPFPLWQLQRCCLQNPPFRPLGPLVAEAHSSPSIATPTLVYLWDPANSHHFTKSIM